LFLSFVRPLVTIVTAQAGVVSIAAQASGESPPTRDGRGAVAPAQAGYFPDCAVTLIVLAAAVLFRGHRRE
jgi:hypothetical protein